jgi:hypothetical protein
MGNVAEVCSECNGEKLVIDIIPGHSDECFTNGKCVPECPLPYEISVPCPVCQTDSELEYIEELLS